MTTPHDNAPQETTRYSKAVPLSPAPVSPPLAAQILTAPRDFALQLQRSSAPAWAYWPAPVLAGVLAGLCYALLLRHGLNQAAAEAVKAAGQKAAAPTVITHFVNGFGTFFLTALTFGAMWGLGRLGAGQSEREAYVPQIYSATFTLLIPLYLLCLVLTLLTPAVAWAIDPARLAAANGDPLSLQRTALQAAAHTPAALLFIAVTLLGTLGQFVLAYPALRETAGDPGRALRAVLLPLLPALVLALLSVGTLVVGRLG